jgi:hypothetical protein
LPLEFWQIDRACVIGKVIGDILMWHFPLIPAVLLQATSTAQEPGSNIAGVVIGTPTPIGFDRVRKSVASIPQEFRQGELLVEIAIAQSKKGEKRII